MGRLQTRPNFEHDMNTSSTKEQGDEASSSTSCDSTMHDEQRHHVRRLSSSSSSCGGTILKTKRLAAFTISLLFLTPHQSIVVQSAAQHDSTPLNQRQSSLYANTHPLNITLINSDPLLTSRSEWIRQSPSLSRLLDESSSNSTYSDDYYALSNDDYNQQLQKVCDDKACKVNEECTRFLFHFLEGSTDAKDNCEGIMNAYVAADCGTIKPKNAYIVADDDDFNDDYLGIFYDKQCCSSLRSHSYQYCDGTGILNELNLLLVAAIMLLCECAKSVIKKNKIRFLPEAAACMLVGMACGLSAGFFGSSLEQFSFDEQIFMYLLLPPIIFEAALTVNKKEFRRRRGSIIIFSVLGTLLSSFITGTITFYSSKYFANKQLDLRDSLVFGALISSIDPVAILSVLTSLDMSETDTIYILVFGESLLNDGVAITLFKSLLEQYNNSATSFDDILGSVADFLIIACGSCAIGLACGIACLCYFHLNSSILHPVMEVASFFLWAVIPYWTAETLEGSGIVAIVCMGFFMDIYLRPGWDPEDILREEREHILYATENQGFNDYHNMDEQPDSPKFRFRGSAIDIPSPIINSTISTNKGEQHKFNTDPHLTPLPEQDQDTSICLSRATSMATRPNVKALLMKKETVRLSREADTHVRFVAHILSQLSENAIFAYLGIFLFSSKYEWDGILCSIGVSSCILSRAIMVLTCSSIIWYFHVIRQRAGCEKRQVLAYVEDGVNPEGSSNNSDDEKVDPANTPISKSVRALSNHKVQVVLILAGLRGAVSLALVESIPIYNGVTGGGSQNKPLLKAMTSSAIIFTIFVLGGGAFYILKWLDISSDDMLVKDRNRADSAHVFIYPTLMNCGHMSEFEMGSRNPRPRYLVVPSPRASPSKALQYTLSADSHMSDMSGLNPIVLPTLSTSNLDQRRRNLV